VMRDLHTSTITTNAAGVGADAVRPEPRMNCDGVARLYRAFEYLAFGGALQSCRRMYLGEVANCRNALLCGDGDGRFLAELLAVNREIRVDFVDLSAGMIQVARRRVDALGSGAIPRTRFQATDVRDFEPRGTCYDLITAHFFLDCFHDHEVTGVTRKLASLARTGTKLLLSDFRIPQRGISRHIDAAIVRGLYGAFRLTTGLRVTRLPDYEGALERAGFRKEKETLKLGGLLVASFWQKI
jgi:SAM-dependent methyltransferase